MPAFVNILRKDFFLISCVLLAAGGSLVAKGPAPFSGEAVDNAIQRGVAYLWSEQTPEGSWPARGVTNDNPVGVSALAAYALLETGVSPKDPRLSKALTWLSKQQTVKTYTLAMRASAFGVAVRRGENKWRKALENDVRALLEMQKNGMYPYGYNEKKGYGSQSNDHFGVLGVWAGKQAGVEVPQKYWSVVLKHWVKTQEQDGGWRYGQGCWSRPMVTHPMFSELKKTTGSMTAAGVVTLYVCHDNLKNKAFFRCQGGFLDKPIDDGLEWLGAHLMDIYSGRHQEHSYPYTLYAIERATLACGYKYFGKVDWYKEGVRHVLQYQKKRGNFTSRGHKRDFIVDTSLVLLFLQRGRNPVVFNKLKHDGDWDNRPRDLANLTAWMGKSLERELSWQIVPFDVEVSEWHDAPILYLSGSKTVEFTNTQAQKLKNYVEQGGTIFSVAECGGKGFRKGIELLYKKIFPKYEFKELPKEHAIYSWYIKGKAGRPKFFAVSNGARILAFHTDTDLSKLWQMNRTISGKWAFDAALNLMLCVTDKGQGLRSRGTTSWPVKKNGGFKENLSVGRVLWTGNANPEPGALKRLALLMGNLRGVNVKISDIQAAKLDKSDVQMAWLTGTGTLKLDTAQIEALKRFVKKGGVFVVDAAGGNSAFAKSAKPLLAKILDISGLDYLPDDCPIYRYIGDEIDKVSYRSGEKQSIGVNRKPWLMGLIGKDKRVVIFSQEDLTTGLTGNSCGMVNGYRSRDATRIAMNFASFAVNRESKK